MSEARALQDTETTVESADGTKLNLRAWPCPSAPRASLAFVHGQGDHSGRYRLPATWFTERGFACLAVDLRGHGRSGGRRGHVVRFTDYLADVDALVEEARRRLPDVPLIVVGHSMGGLVVIRWAIERASLPAAVEGIVVSSPFFALSRGLPIWKRALLRMLSVVHPAFTQPTGIRVEHLTHDRSFVRETELDPLYGTPATARWFTETRKAQREAARRAGEISVPLLFVVSGEDRLVDPAAARRIHDAVTSAPREWHLYPGLRHEVFNELRREEVYADVMAWIDSRLSERPRGRSPRGEEPA